ncbi:MAG: NF038122 family metalloprotease [Verrucomicrobiae bacterium]|nr:NF038122 family metalloprotease [Verrucomicrobiae bacterium]
MMKLLLKALPVMVACGLSTSAYSLTIIPTFDASITNDPNGALMTNAIYAAIRVEQSNFVDNVTLKIHFTNDPSVSLGQSLTSGNDYDYSTFLTALKNSATSRNDTNGYGKIANTSTDPLAGNNKIYLTKAAARLLGLTSGYGQNGFDSTISLKMSLMNFTRPPGNPAKYDLAQVTEHEMDEVMGCSSDLPDLTEISPIDLFRYTTNLARTYITTGDNAYFSVDGTNLLARFNMNSGGDYSDWWSYDSNWLANQTGDFPQVQDAFSNPNNALDLGTNELAMLDVVGWTLAATVAPVPSLRIVRSGVNQYTLSWTNTASGYTLQENTNLLTSATWIASASGATNPVVITSAATRKFYRLYNATASPHLLTQNSAQPKTALPNLAISPDRLHLHITRASQP